VKQAIVVIFNRLGPYHCARLCAAAKLGSLVGLEVVRRDATYQWDLVGDDSTFRRFTLFPECDGQKPAAGELRRRLWSWLDREQPSAVALPGWSAPEALTGLAWALSNSVPAILMSESQRKDHTRKRLRENVKRRVVSLCSAALVGGSRHIEYGADLGLARERIFSGYNTVDNEHFRAGAQRAREDTTLRARLGLPPRFFLTCCRFVREKNLTRLLEAYGRYRFLSADPWSLVLLGNGPLWEEVQTVIRRLSLERSVSTPGFMQYVTLPAYYGLASASILSSVREPWGLVVNEAMAAGLPVLVSERCGCARDLVEEGRNGFTFDPHNVEELSKLMLRLSSTPEDQREAMGWASQEIIARWTPETFAEGLWRAVGAAQAAPQPSLSALDRVLLRLLMHR
jgi:1,2-diacylglycerol 3-alpha-glucosyltransferase